MPRILFIIHGMGVHADGWSDAIVQKLDEVSGRYEAFRAKPFSDRITIHPVGYDAILSAERARWGDAAAGLRDHLQVQGISLGAGADILDWLATAQKGESSFFWSHLIDVLLYRYVDAVTRQVRLHVIESMARALRDAQAQGEVTEASVLAHSLGTSVAHDALALLGSVPVGGSRAFTAAEGYRFSNLFMLANVSRVLQTDPGPYSSVVYPQSQDRPGGYLLRYYNFRHEYDPVPLVRPFAPVGWLSHFVNLVQLSHLHAFNVHGFEHYLDSPAVHVPILNAMLGRRIPAEEQLQAERDYPPVAGLPCPEKVASFVLQARRMVDLVRGSEDPKRLVIAGSQFLSLAQEMKDACL